MYYSDIATIGLVIGKLHIYINKPNYWKTYHYKIIYFNYY